ncbi:hypothetical protein ACROYT_G008397 [Oculina patagonica]
MSLPGKILVFLLATNVGCHGQELNCYKCASGLSWRECAYNQLETKCSRENDKCITIELRGKYGESGFVRDCVDKSTCNKEDLVQCQQAEECDFDCCNGDLCNASPNTQASGVLLMSCALSLLYIAN